jgi:glucose/arabinose dehydrogenase
MSKASSALGLSLALALAVGCDDDKAPICSTEFRDGVDSSTTTTTCPELQDTGVPQRDSSTHEDASSEMEGGPRDAEVDPPDASEGSIQQPVCSTAKAPDLEDLGAETVVGGLTNLVYATQPKGSSDWYLVEQAGIVKVLKAGSTTPTVFLDIKNIANNAGGGDERGLLSVAFPPDYATSGSFYVMVSPTSGEFSGHDMVFRYKRKTSDPYQADVAMRETILDVPASQTNHNGGTVLFGPDGMLYVGTGDGGLGCNADKPGAPQELDSVFGKLLRLDPSKPAPYAAAGNPFASSGDARVLHYGLRNPFRFGFDSYTGDLYVGDVGQEAYEEINFAPKGSTGFNFGWAAFEGTSATCVGRMLRAGSQHTTPIVVVDRRAGSQSPFFDYHSVIGGVVYRGADIEKLRGAYLFGDYVGTRLGAVYQCGQQTSAISTLLRSCDGNDEACLPTAAGITSVAAIVEGTDREVYIVASRTKLLKLVEL